MMRILYLLILIQTAFIAEAQFIGGDGDGFGSDSWEGNNLLYQGNDRDGFSSILILGTNKFYQGEANDGFTSIEFINTDLISFQGSQSDGFSHTNLSATDLILYQGENKDGFSSTDFEGADLKLYQGLDKDGFALGNLFQQYIWTGALGTGWNVAGNWSGNLTPKIRHQAIIPEGVPNYPMVNAGILSIGKNPNDADYTCSELLVRKNAELTARVNCFVENYGNLEIRGTMTVKNPDPNALRVFSNAQLTINSEGTLIFQQ